jgi:hypothetical protein
MVDKAAAPIRALATIGFGIHGVWCPAGIYPGLEQVEIEGP